MATDDLEQTGSGAGDTAGSSTARHADSEKATPRRAPGGRPAGAREHAVADTAGNTPPVDEIKGADPGPPTGIAGIRGTDDDEAAPGGNANTGGGVKGATPRDVDVDDAVSGE